MRRTPAGGGGAPKETHAVLGIPVAVSDVKLRGLACFKALLTLQGYSPFSRSYDAAGNNDGIEAGAGLRSPPVISLRSHAWARRSSRRTMCTGMESAVEDSSAVMPPKN